MIVSRTKTIKIGVDRKAGNGGPVDPVLSSSSFGISRRAVSSGGIRDGENSVSADTYINALFREPARGRPGPPLCGYCICVTSTRLNLHATREAMKYSRRRYARHATRSRTKRTPVSPHPPSSSLFFSSLSFFLTSIALHVGKFRARIRETASRYENSWFFFQFLALFRWNRPTFPHLMPTFSSFRAIRIESYLFKLDEREIRMEWILYPLEEIT